MVSPVLSGDVSGVTLHGASIQGYEDATVKLENNALPPQMIPVTTSVDFSYSSGALQPGQKIHFEASAPDAPGRSFEWILGDGTHAEGRSIEHRYADAEGTLLDGSGRFRVLLHVLDADGEQSWSSQSVVLARKPLAALVAAAITPSPNKRSYSRMLHVPADGGYTFTLLTSTHASLSIDSVAGETPQARPQVCGSPGDAVQAVRVSVVLRAGLHRIRVERDDAIENASTVDDKTPLLLWEGPGIVRETIPSSAFQP